MKYRQRRGRWVQGILLLDKSEGLGSNEALQQVKQLFRARKAGHTGSLDRLASGLLPICFGEATKVSGFLLNADKQYRAVLRLGNKTTTGDAEGEVVHCAPVRDLSEQEVLAVLEKFKGTTEQIPPMHSAIKFQGQRLYQLAQKGLVVDRKPRKVIIHRLCLLGLEPQRLHIEVSCSKGTYVRTLAQDIGDTLGCGAYVQTLRRIGSGPFGDKQMVSLDALRALAEQGLEELDRTLLPMETAVADWPGVNLSEEVAYYLRRGQPVLVPHAPTQGWVKIYEEPRNFLGVGEVLDDGRIAPRRLINVGSQRI